MKMSTIRLLPLAASLAPAQPFPAFTHIKTNGCIHILKTCKTCMHTGTKQNMTIFWKKTPESSLQTSQRFDPMTQWHTCTYVYNRPSFGTDLSTYLKLRNFNNFRLYFPYWFFQNFVYIYFSQSNFSHAFFIFPILDFPSFGTDLLTYPKLRNFTNVCLLFCMLIFSYTLFFSLSKFFSCFFYLSQFPCWIFIHLSWFINNNKFTDVAY